MITYLMIFCTLFVYFQLLKVFLSLKCHTFATLSSENHHFGGHETCVACVACDFHFKVIAVGDWSKIVAFDLFGLVWSSKTLILNTLLCKKWGKQDLNLRPTDYESVTCLYMTTVYNN